MAKVEPVKAVGASTILEGPHWVSSTNNLYFVDILEGTIFRYDYDNDKCYKAKVEGETTSKTGFILPVEGKSDHFVIGAGAKLLLIQWDGISTMAKSVKVLAEVEKDLKVTRFNDGKVSPCGRIYAGTMLSEEHGDIFTARVGSFYKYHTETGTCVQLKSKINISNGLTWNEKKKKFYFIDTGDCDVKEYDFDPVSGDISNEKVLINFKPADHGPDGMTIDQDGNLYVAAFKSGKVLKVNPETKKVEMEIVIPNATQITSVAFGGPGLDELFVTTARLDGKPAPAGGLFKVTGLGKGTKMTNVKLN